MSESPPHTFSHVSDEGAHILATLIGLSKQARASEDISVLQFLLVNETHQLIPYRQAIFWDSSAGVRAISGLVSIEDNAPFVQWLNSLLPGLEPTPGPLALDRLSPLDVQAWSEWLAPQALWLPLAGADAGMADAGLLLVRDDPAWSLPEQALLEEWLGLWRESWLARQAKPRATWLQWLWPRPAPRSEPAWTWRRLWQHRATRILLFLALIGLIPVRLTVLGPGELVPAQPALVRAPLDGVVESILVEPNQPVGVGQPLLTLDRTLLQGELQVARQALATLEADYRRGSEQAIFQATAPGEVTLIKGRLQEQRAEVVYLEERLAQGSVVAAQAGIALFTDPTEWVGRPVVTGERIMVIADPQRVELEGWLSPSDAIALPEQARVKLYLHSAPLSPVIGTLRNRALQPEQRPDGSFAYRLRATLEAEGTLPQIGQRGTLKVIGHWTTLAGWLLRRPLAAARTTLGL
jgi:hypothetical protein